MTNPVTHRLDRLEEELPALPTKTIAFGRATARRTSSVATAVIGEVSNRAGNVIDMTSTAVRTVAGQARSAVDRSARQVRSGVNEVRGQTLAQVDRVASVAEREAESALDDAHDAMAPEPTDRDGLQLLTKQELYDRAQDLEIEGRSSMSKDELVDAIVAA